MIFGIIFIPVSYICYIITTLGPGPWYNGSINVVTAPPGFQSRYADRYIFENTSNRHIFECFPFLPTRAHRSLSKGIHPDKDMLGDPFPKGSFRWERRGQKLHEEYRGIIAMMKHDRKERRVAHQMKRNWKSSFVCDRCLAVNPYKHIRLHGLFFTDLGPQAGWRRTIITAEMYAEQEQVVSPYARHIDGFSKDGIMDDWLHDGYLGVGGPHVAGFLAFSEAPNLY